MKKMRKECFIILALLSCPWLHAFAADSVKTNFQTAREWKETIDNRADAVMLYGVDGNPSDRRRQKPDFEQRVKSWRDHGYYVQFMTGIAWGEYVDYFTGGWDGKKHLSEGQVKENGDTIWHGHLVPYIVPTEEFADYIKQRHIRRVIDAGITDIFLEEPEFWAKSGYGSAFKDAWQEYYGSGWQPQHTSPENTYLSNKLKYHLYYRTLEDVCTFAKEYGRSKGLDVKCYVATHSLVNYTQWEIVSPEASLASLSCIDGYVAQIWTGTSRERNWYNGKRAERVFETAYLEYGSMESMTAPTGRKMYFLTDPIEDRARDWNDYARNYQATFVAQLLYPNIASYEIMPWPERIYEGKYRVSADSDVKDLIPVEYATRMQIMTGALQKMPLSEEKLSGTQGVGVLMSNSLMFQRFPLHDGYRDPDLSNFYGMALPLLKRGVPVKTVHMENLPFGALKDIDVLIMTYSNMKPMEPESHSYIADWVRAGGHLVYCSSDTDPFQTVREWWNSGSVKWDRPADHLFSLMGIGAGAGNGHYSCGAGSVDIIRTDPKELVMKQDNDMQLVSKVNGLVKGGIVLKNNFTLRRGQYLISSVMNESVSQENLELKGRFIDVFDPHLSVLDIKVVRPGEQSLLIDLSRIDKSRPQVLAASSREEQEVVSGHSYSFVAKAPVRTENVSRVYLPSRPKSIFIDGKDMTGECVWDKTSRTVLLSFLNRPEGVKVEIKY
jgi:hypothetical protein